jgi:hypothetical protein
MAVTIGDVTIRIGASTKTLNRDLRNAERSLQASAAKFQAIGSSLTLGITAPLALIGGASFKMASDFEESLNKVRVAFGDSAADVESFAKTTLTSIGLAEGSALEMASLFGDMATSMGLTQPAAAQMSKSLVSLAGDLSSFKNINISEAQTALAGVFTGETESLKRLGIVMTETNLQAFALEQGINKKVNAMTQAEKVSLRYAYIMNSTKNAQGDFARTAGGAANQMRTFQESVKQLGAQFGSILLPIITPIIVKVNELVAKFTGLDDRTKKLIVTIAAIAAALGPAIFIFGKLSFAVGILQIAWVKLNLAFAAGGIKAAFAFLGGPAILIVGAIAAAIYLIYKNWETVKKSMVDVANYFVDLYNESLPFRASMNYIVFNFKQIAAAATLAFKIILSALELVGKSFINTFKNAGALIKAVLTGDFDAIPGLIKNAFTEGFGNVKTLLNDTSKNFAEFNATTLANAKEAIDNTFNAQAIKQFSLETKKATTDVKKAVEEIPEVNLNITGDEKPLTDLEKALQKLNIELTNIQRQFQAGLITSQEAAAQRADVLKKKLELLVNAGFSPTSKAVVDLQKQLRSFDTTTPLNILPTGAADPLGPLSQIIDKRIQEIRQKTTEDLNKGLQGKVTFKSTSYDAFFKDFRDQIDLIDIRQERGFITTGESDAQKIEFLTTSLKNLQDQGFSPLSPQILAIETQLESLGISITDNLFTKLETGQQVVQAFASNLTTLIGDAFATVGETIGAAFSGETNIATFFNRILSSVADFAKSFGKQLIAIGIAKLSLENLFKAGPVGAAAAIAAGTALIAISSAIQSNLAKKLPSLAIGTDYVKQDGLAMLHKGEAVVPADVAGGGFSRAGGSTEVFGRLSGIDLLLSNQYAAGYQKRLR